MHTTSSHQLPVFDSHFHIIDGRFPLRPNNGYLPESFTCEDYLRQVASYSVAGGALVSGSFQAFDQTYLVQALKQLGPDFVGVTQIPADYPDDGIIALDRAGIRAVRVNLRRGGSAQLAELDRLARRVYELVGWHMELYVDAGDLPALTTLLLSLPAVSIDHLGLRAVGFTHLLRLVGQGVRVKASGFGRVDFDIPQALRELDSANPNALMFGTDLPSTRAPRPFRPSDIDVLVDTLGDARAGSVLSTNAREFYRLAPGS